MVMLTTAVLLCLGLCATLSTATTNVAVHQVKAGQTAVLLCPSNDDEHRFQFWQLVGDQIIGPGNDFDRAKYKYEVLEGTLYIRSVSTAEAGFYKCITRSIEHSAVNIKAVELIVTKDWEEVYETDYETNLFRGLISVGVVLMVIVIAVLLYVFRQRRTSRFRDISDEESPDEGRMGGTYNPTTVPVSKVTKPTNEGIDNAALDTDFPMAFPSSSQDSRM